MNKEELIDRLESWNDSGEHEKIIAAVMALPDSALDDEILSLLARAYNNTGEYKKAIAVLESLRGRMDNSWLWQYRMGYALFHASSDDECADDEVLRRNILDRARNAFARCMNMNPPEDVLEECDMFIESIESDIDDEDYDEEIPDAEMYDEEEMDTVEEHIKEYFGEFPTVYHEIHSPDIHVDICIVPPTPERNYYTLVTMGMGAHIMDIPEELDPKKSGRAELLICLPPDWRVGESDEEWFWPITLLKNLARLPINCDTWLGWGHSVDNQQTFSRGTELCGSVLIRPEDVADGADSCELPNGDTVSFFEVIPVYREEMTFKIDNDTESLLGLMNGVSHITDISRPNCCEGYESPEEDPDVFSGIADSAHAHIESIRQKQLPLDELSGCNHIAIYLRWCIEHDLVCEQFSERYPDVVSNVKNGLNTDLRGFIMGALDGLLFRDLFNFEGASFADYYYGSDDDREHSFPCDVDKYAEQYFGTEKYNCAEFKDEAYLFVPFDEEYYRGLSAFIDRSYADFRAVFYEKLKDAAEEFSMRMSATLDCRCTSYNSGNPAEVRKALKDARIRGKAEGFQPLLLACDPQGICTDGEGLLKYYSDIDFSPLTIAEVPLCGGDPVEALLSERFDSVSSSPIRAEGLSELQKKYEELFGEAPSVISLTDEYPAFLIPLSDGWFRFYKTEFTSGIHLDYDAEEDDSELIPAFISLLDCRCRLFGPADNDEELNKAYAEALERGKTEGFTPVFIAPDRRMWNNIMTNTEAADINEEYDFSPEKIKRFRSELLSRPLPDGEKILAELIGERREEAEENGGEWDDIVGYIANGDPLRFLLSLWNEDEQGTRPVILAEIPTANPWEVFAYVPFGAWGNCPDTQIMTAIAKYWYERHGAVPAVIAHNELNFAVRKPVARGKALPLAVEMYGVCPEIISKQGAVRSVGELADGLRNSTVWFFHWE